jgi:hypothetical protein
VVHAGVLGGEVPSVVLLGLHLRGWSKAAQRLAQQRSV